MKAVRALFNATSFSNTKSSNQLLQRFFYSAQPLNPDAVFDSSHFDDNNNNNNNNDHVSTWDHKYRDRVNTKLFDEQDIIVSNRMRILDKEEEKKKRAGALASSLLDYRQPEEEEIDVAHVKVEDQMSLSVGIIGAPNAGKSALTNYIVGTKVSAVSRKVNTTTHEVLGVMTQGTTQICFFDTPGLMLKKSGIPYRDIKIRNQSAWSSIDLYDVLIVIFDVHRHVTRPDSRVVRLIERMGSMASPSQKRVLCMNKVDLVPKKNDLLKVAKEFKDLPGYDTHFLISGLKGAGVKDLTRYLSEQIRLITIDVTGTLLAYKGELGDYYCMAAKAAGQQCPDYKRMHQGFKLAYTDMAKKHPCFGFAEKMPNIVWWKTCVRDSFVRAGYDYDEETFEKIFRRIYATFGSSAPYTIFSDSVPFLRWVRQKGILVGIVSNSEYRYPDVILPALGLHQGSEWDFGVFSGLEGVEKPDPRLYEIALGRAGNIVPAEALHIGDSMRKDYLPAKTVGMHALLLDRFKTPDAESWRKSGATVLPNLVAVQDFLSSKKLDDI